MGYTSLRVLAALVGLAAAAWGCSDDEGGAPASTGGSAGAAGAGAGGVTADKVSQTIQLSCTDYGGAGTADDMPYSGQVVLTSVYACTYDQKAKVLTVGLTGTSYSAFDVVIKGFTAPGTFPTTTNEDIRVSMMASDGEAAGGTEQSVPPGSFEAHPCTIQVLDTNLHTVQVPAGSEAPGWLILDVDCPKVAEAGVGACECTASPAKTHFELASCRAI